MRHSSGNALFLSLRTLEFFPTRGLRKTLFWEIPQHPLQGRKASSKRKYLRGFTGTPQIRTS